MRWAIQTRVHSNADTCQGSPGEAKACTAYSHAQHRVSSILLAWKTE